MSGRIKDSTLATLREVVDGDPYHKQFRPLIDEIDWLRDELDEANKAYGTCDMENAVLYETRDKLYEENAQLRAAIDRVRALCDKPHQFVIAWEVLRALDGEDA
jgi:predicted nuclease with TOPRIM domain